jgi:cortactin
MSDDDWDTDPDFVNDVSEKQQRWGNKGVLRPPPRKHAKVLRRARRTHAHARRLTDTAGVLYSASSGTGKMVDIKAVQDEVRKADEEKAKAKSGFQRGYGGEHGHESSGASLCH